MRTSCALRWLVSQQDSQGFLGGKANRYARMYCHGMATIALGEAYGMTKDRALREPPFADLFVTYLLTHIIRVEGDLVEVERRITDLKNIVAYILSQ